MRFPVFLDTNALYPASLTDTLLRLAEADVIRPHWSADVLDELERNLAERVGTGSARKRRVTMEAAFPEAMVTGYEAMVDAMENDPKDRHVLAAAIHSDCELIVTFKSRISRKGFWLGTDLLLSIPTVFCWISSTSTRSQLSGRWLVRLPRRPDPH